MKQNNKKQTAGVWLDSTNAIIISNNDENETGYAVQHKVKANGSHSGGSEHTMNNARQTDSIKYFKLVSSHLVNYDEILVFGPGKSQEQFQNYLHDDAQFKTKKIAIDNTEQLTDPQMIAKVRDFFKS